MHHPPDVRFQVTTPIWGHLIFQGFCALALLQTALFYWDKVSPVARFIAGVFLCSLVCGSTWRWLVRRSSGLLQWSNMQWQWSGTPGTPCTVRIHLDFQTLVLVCVHSPKSPSVWHWLFASENPSEWLALRRALVYTNSDHHRHRQVNPERKQPEVGVE